MPRIADFEGPRFLRFGQPNQEQIIVVVSRALGYRTSNGSYRDTLFYSHAQLRVEELKLIRCIYGADHVVQAGEKGLLSERP